ncbi:hypothetical protein M3Y99_01591100 [Aphelenchoides fujianensis]|nr:hypothetical protein M3Y99_01591100 [Aphelenchoides fujianensis]
MSQQRPIEIRPDYDTDVLWKPPRLGLRTRTISVDSSSSDVGAQPQRRFSISEYFGGPFLQRQTSLTSQDGELLSVHKKSSITENPDFQELLKRQKRILE